MQKVVVHDGHFHPDDVFAVAALQLHLGIENVLILRTRDISVIESGDWVADVGGVYDPTINRFDHHQAGAPVRENGIPYAAFGLVWKAIGESVTGSVAVAAKIEERLCQPIDAADNGVSLYNLNNFKVAPVEIQSVIFSFFPLITPSDEAVDAAFVEAVQFAREYLLRYIQKTTLKQAEKQRAIAVYEKSTSKKIVVHDEHISTSDLIQYDELLVIVSPAPKDRWKARIVPLTKEEPFSSRARFPLSWAGKEGQQLSSASGILGLEFCHKSRHLVFSTTKAAAIAAAEAAIENGVE